MLDLILAVIFLVGLYHSTVFLYRLFKKKQIGTTSISPETEATLLIKIIADLKQVLASEDIKSSLERLIQGYQIQLPATEPTIETSETSAHANATQSVESGAVESRTDAPASIPPQTERTARPTPRPVRQQPQQDVFGEWYKDNSINLLMYLGAFLIVMAAIAFLGFTWDILSGGLRFASLLALTVAFAAAGFGFYQNEKVRKAGVTFIGISALLLPINGTAFQLFVMPNDASPGITWLISSAICMLYYIYIFKLIPNKFYTIIIHLSSLSLVSSFVNIAEGNPEWYVFGAIIDSYILYFANLKFLKGLAAEIRKLTDQSSHSILVISVLFGLIYSIGENILFTWPTVIAIALAAGYYLLRYHFGEKYGFLVALLFSYVALIIGMETAGLDSIVRVYVVSLLPFLYLGLATLYRRKHYETTVARRVSLGAFWVALIWGLGVALEQSSTLFTPHTTIQMLLSAAFHGLHFRRYNHLGLFIASQVSFFLAIVWAIATWQPDTTLALVIFFGWFLISIIASKLVSGHQREVRWNISLTIGYSALISLFYFGEFIRLDQLQTNGMAVLILGNALLHGYLFAVWNRNFGFTALLLQYLLLAHFCWWQDFSSVPTYLLLYGLTCLQMLGLAWLERAKVIAAETRYLFLAPVLATMLTQASVIQYNSAAVIQVPVTLFLSALFSTVTYVTWHKYAYSFIHGCIGIGLFTLAAYLELSTGWVVFLIGIWSVVLLVGFQAIKERFPDKQHEAVSTLISSSVFSFLLLNYVNTRWTPAQDALATSVWVLFMGVSYVLSRYQAYLYVFFATLLLAVGMLDTEYTAKWYPNLKLLSVLFTIMSAGITYGLTFSLPRKPLIFGSGLFFLFSYFVAISDLPNGAFLPVLAIFSNLPLAVYISKQWGWDWLKYGVITAAYLPVLAITSYFALPEWNTLGIVLVASLQFFAAGLVQKQFYPDFESRMQRLAMGVASIMTLLDTSVTLGKIDLPATLNCVTAALSAGLVTEYWRRYKPAKLEYLVAALWVLVLLRIFNRMSIEEAQFYVQPIAFYLLGVGVYNQLKQRENANLLQIAGLTISIAPLFFSSFGMDGFWYAATLFAEGIALLALGINLNFKYLKNGGIVALALGTFAQTAQYLFNIPWWVWLGITGIGLLAAGTVLLSKKK